MIDQVLYNDETVQDNTKVWSWSPNFICILKIVINREQSYSTNTSYLWTDNW